MKIKLGETFKVFSHQPIEQNMLEKNPFTADYELKNKGNDSPILTGDEKEILKKEKEKLERKNENKDESEDNDIKIKNEKLVNKIKDIFNKTVSAYSENEIDVVLKKKTDEFITFLIKFKNEITLLIYYPKNNTVKFINKDMDNDNFADVSEDIQMKKDFNKDIGNILKPLFKNEKEKIEKKEEEKVKNPVEEKTNEKPKEKSITKPEIPSEPDVNLEKAPESDKKRLKEEKELVVTIDKKNSVNFEDIMDKENYYFDKKESSKIDRKNIFYYFPDSNPEQLQIEIDKILNKNNIKAGYQIMEDIKKKSLKENKIDNPIKIDKIYSDNEWVVFKPLTFEASKKYGSPMWDISHEKGKAYFDKYNKLGGIYMVFDKKNGKKFALNFKDNIAIDDKNEHLDVDEFINSLPYVIKRILDIKKRVSTMSENKNKYNNKIKGKSDMKNSDKYKVGEIVKINMALVETSNPTLFKTINSIARKNKGYACIVSCENGKIKIAENLIIGKVVGGIEINEEAISKLDTKKDVDAYDMTMRNPDNNFNTMLEEQEKERKLLKEKEDEKDSTVIDETIMDISKINKLR